MSWKKFFHFKSHCFSERTWMLIFLKFLLDSTVPTVSCTEKEPLHLQRLTFISLGTLVVTCDFLSCGLWGCQCQSICYILVQLSLFSSRVNISGNSTFLPVPQWIVLCTHPTLEIIGFGNVCRNPVGWRMCHLELGMVMVFARPLSQADMEWM